MCVLLGDFNINLHKSDSPSMANFLNTLYSTYFFPQILKPSQITSSSAFLIDNIFFNSMDFDTTSGLLMSDISDHLPVSQIIHTKGYNRCNNSDHAHSKYRKFTRKNMESFKSLISAISWDEVARLAPTGGPFNYLKLPHSQGTLNTLWFSPA